MIRTQAEALALLRAAIDRAGGVRAYARAIVRDHRTVNDWLAGKRLIPAAVIDKLEREATP